MSRYSVYFVHDADRRGHGDLPWIVVEGTARRGFYATKEEALEQFPGARDTTDFLLTQITERNGVVSVEYDVRVPQDSMTGSFFALPHWGPGGTTVERVELSFTCADGTKVTYRKKPS